MLSGERFLEMKGLSNEIPFFIYPYEPEHALDVTRGKTALCFAQEPAPRYTPAVDNVLPIVDGDWFEGDIVARFRRFLQVAFGDEHFEENLRFIEESLGVKSLREYFITRAGGSRFYDDHVKRYKKRPIYLLFSSPKGSFNALIYMHRYTPSTVSIVFNEYLRGFIAKLEANLQHQERVVAGDSTACERASALKEAERLRKIMVELSEYEHDVLYPWHRSRSRSTLMTAFSLITYILVKPWPRSPRSKRNVLKLKLGLGQPNHLLPRTVSDDQSYDPADQEDRRLPHLPAMGAGF